MKKFLLLFSVLLFPCWAGAAETSNPNEMFAQANQAFEKGDLERAGEIYQSLIRQGFESPELYYNTGNWHYRKGERGKAILWYERALQLAPRDSDIQFNLSLACSHIKDEDTNLLRKIFLYFTGGELAWALTFLIWTFFGILGCQMLGWIAGDTWPNVVLWFSGALLFLTACWFGVNVSFAREPLAIVTNPPGEVRNGPGPDYAVGFTIPEGSKVLVLNKRPEWTQVGVPAQGLKGWMPNGEVESIIPNLASSN